ncbi:hypothetical protein RPN65_00505, partial [Staphylococcus ureilyticus]|nr:hypothetical protein [Staphylococcus ureilyticus]
NFLSTKENGVITNAKNDEEIRFAYISNSIGNTKSNRDFKTKNETKKYIKDKNIFKIQPLFSKLYFSLINLNSNINITKIG